MSALRGSSSLASSSSAALSTAVEANAGVRPMPASDPEQIFFRFDILRSLQMHKKLAIGILATALLACAAYVARGWNSYTAQALVYVQPAPPRLLSNGPENRWPYDSNTYESYIQQQIHNVTRQDVLATAATRVPGWLRSGENPQLAAVRLGGALLVARVGSGYQISITAKAKDAQKAAELANAVAASYIESSTRELRAGDQQRIQLLGEERIRVQQELGADRTEQDDLNKKLGVASLGGTPVDPVDEQISAVRAELTKARADNDEAAARLMATAKGGAASSASLDAQADDLVTTDPGMVSMKMSLNTRRSQLISQMANLTPNNPMYKQDSEELAKINSSLESMTQELRAKAAAHIEQKLKTDLEQTSSVEGRLNAQLAQLTASAGTAGPRLQRLNELSVDIQRLQGRFATVDEQFRNLTMENNAPGAIYLSSPAVVPLVASRELVFRNAFVLVLAGFLLSVGAALLANNLDQRIYIAADVERVLGFAPMAQLPDFNEVGAGVEEEYLLRLAAALEHAYQQGELKSCIFTGVAAGSGATTVSTRITDMLEAMGRSTVLVNASGSPAPPPPAEDASDAEPGLVHSPRSTRSTALLQQMAEETGEDTIVLSDTAPLLVSGETEYLARFVDSAIVIIQSGVTTRAQLRDVAHTLQRLDVSAVGFVLNRISKDKANSSFRDSVHAVEQRIYGSSRANSGEEKKPKARAPKKKAPKDDDPEPHQGKAHTGAPDAAASNRMVTPDPAVETMVQGAASAAAEPRAAEPAPAEMKPVEQAPVSSPYTVTPSAPAFEPQAASVTQRVENSIEEEGSALPLRGRTLRRSIPQSRPDPIHQTPATPPQPPAAVPPAPVFAEATLHVPIPPAPQPAFVAEVRVQPVAAPAPAPVASPTPASAPEPAPFYPEHSLAAMAGANPAAVQDFALQARSSAPEGDLREIPYSAARLGGLRNLLVSLGLRSLNNKEGEYREATDPGTEPRSERVVERPVERSVYAEPLAPATPAFHPEFGFDPALVTAKPEFLPPRPLVEAAEGEPDKETGAPAAPRKSRPDSSEEAATLPSWRGQYRKRR